MLVLKSFLLMRCKGAEPPHAPLNEAAELSAQLSPGIVQSRYLAIIFALQGTLSLEAGRFEEAMERAAKGIKAISQLRQTEGSHNTALAMELGDLLTVQGKAQLGLKNFLRAEELLDEALSSFESGGGAGKEGRCAEALLYVCRRVSVVRHGALTCLCAAVHWAHYFATRRVSPMQRACIVA